MTYMFRNIELNNTTILSSALAAVVLSYKTSVSSVHTILSGGLSDLTISIRHVIPCIGNNLQIHDKEACISETSGSGPFLLPICKQLTFN